jgi:sugar/nucleoside kinase (ribokinase family)
VSAPRLVILGSLTTDNVLTADRMPLPQRQGGNVIYAALGASIWSNEVGIVSRAGSNYERTLLDQVADRSVDIAGVRWLDEPHEMNVAFRYRADGSRDRFFPPDVLAGMPAVERERFRDYTTRGNEHRFRVWRRFAPDFNDVPVAWRPLFAGMHLAAMPVDRHIQIAKELREARPESYLQVDSPWYDPRDLAIRHSDVLFPLIDRLLPSEDDIRIESGAMPREEAASHFRARGLASIVIKLGQRGCLVIDGNLVTPVHLPACEVVAIDPTGAGDAFCGGFLAGFVEHGNVIEAALQGAVSASFAIEAAGPEGLLKATVEHAEARLQAVRQRVGDEIVMTTTRKKKA